MSCGGGAKRFTNITGLPVAKNPHKLLAVLYGKILRTLQKMPENAAYRKYTEDIINERSQILICTPSVEDVEKEIGCGQIEEIIVQAENELSLSRKMLAWKPWDALVNQPPPGQWSWPPAQAVQQR
ncbi:unnamed protein product [Ceutorhynchus assimilis]|uniref:NADH dehydrogenase [ubiquinone] 1 alpha subcomplex subunit 5 n=1 Tax=Ceutorhynchus assimilis TaxID=467358 RepID=A0A9N9QGM8_9CUCU|nr:unnamed protein product [Ceutorhynchus assimilis]